MNTYIQVKKREITKPTNFQNSQESVSLLVWLLQEDSRVSAAKGRVDDFFRYDDPTPPTPASWNGEDKEPFLAWIINYDVGQKGESWSTH